MEKCKLVKLVSICYLIFICLQIQLPLETIVELTATVLVSFKFGMSILTAVFPIERPVFSARTFRRPLFFLSLQIVIYSVLICLRQSTITWFRQDHNLNATQAQESCVNA